MNLKSLFWVVFQFWSLFQLHLASRIIPDHHAKNLTRKNNSTSRKLIRKSLQYLATSQRLQLAKNLSPNQHHIPITEVIKLTIESNRTMGGVSAILILIGIISQLTSLFQATFPNSIAIAIFSGIGGIFSVLSFVGLILFIIAMYGFSKDYREPKIFSNILNGLIITIIAAIIVGAIFVIAVLFNLANLFPNLGSSASSSSQISSSLSKLFSEALPFFSLVGVIWIAFNVLSLNLLADKSRVSLFKIGAKVLLAGALVNVVLAIIFAVVGFYIVISTNVLLALLVVGGLVQDIAWLLLALAFFRIQSPTLPVSGVTPNVAPASVQVKYCPNCGAPNLPDASYCTRCGQKI